ncbi:hypothetical protein B0T18DRAFT_391254 [Schizothecium vesticola]|uniref:Uncharacterized protein n=1 Tax=Schizothecium vesticola TaxID=314040 RepID=A0AA40EWJ7_9PEZI|nr:hypothetical protein B0T18DRAFT_391254 [Schizothecium vesticola]
MDTTQPTTPTSPLINTSSPAPITTPSTPTTPPQPPSYTSPEALALASQIDTTHSPDALITLLNTLPATAPIDYPRRLLHAAAWRDTHPSKTAVLFSRLVDVHALHPSPSTPDMIQTALLHALSEASRTLNIPGATLLLRLGADPWSDTALAMEAGMHPLLLALGQTFPAYAGDAHPVISVGTGIVHIPGDVGEVFGVVEEVGG